MSDRKDVLAISIGLERLLDLRRDLIEGKPLSVFVEIVSPLVTESARQDYLREQARFITIPWDQLPANPTPVTYTVLLRDPADPFRLSTKECRLRGIAEHVTVNGCRGALVWFDVLPATK